MVDEVPEDEVIDFYAESIDHPVREEIPDHEIFDGSLFKMKADGTWKMSDFVDHGETYVGQTASLADTSEDTGDVGAMDNPGDLRNIHRVPQYPDGTWTVHVSTPSTGPLKYYYSLYEYRATLSRVGNVWWWSFQMVDRREQKDTPKYIIDMGIKGGYWYRGKRVNRIVR